MLTYRTLRRHPTKIANIFRQGGKRKPIIEHSVHLIGLSLCFPGHEKCMFHHDLELDHRPLTREAMLPEMSRSYKLLLSSLGEDPERPGLLKTPERAAKAMLFFTKGYDQSLEGKFHYN